MKLVEIRQVIEDHTKRLDPHGTFTRNAYPQAFGAGYVKKNSMGQYLHGLNSDEVKSYSESLGMNLASNEDGNKNPEAKVSYWTTKQIPFYNPNQDYVTLDLDNLEELLTYKAGIASGYYAPSREEIGSGLYLHTNYYVYDTTKETTKKQSLRQKKNKIGEKLAKNEKNDEWLKYVAFALEIPAYNTSTPSYFYDKIDSLKDEATNLERLEEILTILNKTPLDLQINYTVKKAKLYKILNWSGVENEYMFNDQKFGATDEDCIKNFSDVANANNLNLLMTEVSKREKNK